MAEHVCVHAIHGGGVGREVSYIGKQTAARAARRLEAISKSTQNSCTSYSSSFSGLGSAVMDELQIHFGVSWCIVTLQALVSQKGDE